MVSNALIIVPAINLVEQMLDEKKLRASAELYGFTREAFGQVQTVNAPPRLSRLKSATISAITTSMSNRHLQALEQWVEHMKAPWPTGSGLPPVVYMDEAHLGSDANRWGNIVRVLSEAGAYVVMMTATPFRTDGRPIPGFEIEDRRFMREDALGNQTVQYEIKPHWETTLPQALGEPSSPVAYVSYQPFGITGIYRYAADERVDRVILSDLEEPEIRRAYRESLRDPEIMEKAITFFLTDLSNRRREARQARASGIIFVGNHEAEFDNWDNEHAINVREIVNRLSGHRLRCEVIVSSDPEAQNLLDAFIEGDVDVAIVKQMGAIGLDVEQLKVSLDLSNTRSPAYFMQRLMRIATRWEGDGGGTSVPGTYIAPDDPITKRSYEAVYGDAAIIFSTTEIETPRLPIEFPSLKSPPQGPSDSFMADGVVLTGDLQDFSGTKAPAAYIPVTDSFAHDFPEATGISKAKLADWLVRAGVPPNAAMAIPDGASSEGSGIKAGEPEPAISNITKALDAERQRVSALGKQTIAARFEAKYKTSYTSALQTEYSREAALFWAEHADRVGLKGTALKDIDNLEKLKSIRRSIEQETKRGKDNGIR